MGHGVPLPYYIYCLMDAHPKSLLHTAELETHYAPDDNQKGHRKLGPGKNFTASGNFSTTESIRISPWKINC